MECRRRGEEKKREEVQGFHVFRRQAAGRNTVAADTTAVPAKKEERHLGRQRTIAEK